MKTTIYLIICISLFSTIIFGFIEALCFLFVEESVQNKIIKTGLNKESAEILTSALSTAISIFAAVWVEGEIIKKFKVISHPVISSIGILLGALLFVLIYNVFIKLHH